MIRGEGWGEVNRSNMFRGVCSNNITRIGAEGEREINFKKETMKKLTHGEKICPYLSKKETRIRQNRIVG